jgi:hypothetical protein
MKFAWPEMLWLLLAVPAIIAWYLVLLRRKKKAALRYASLSIVKEAIGSGQGVRRHLPPYCCSRDCSRYWSRSPAPMLSSCCPLT